MPGVGAGKGARARAGSVLAPAVLTRGRRLPLPAPRAFTGSQRTRPTLGGRAVQEAFAPASAETGTDATEGHGRIRPRDAGGAGGGGGGTDLTGGASIQVRTLP